MKKFIAMICAVAMSASMAITAVAAPSIGQLIPEAPVLVAGEFPEGYELAVQNADTSAYEVKDVAVSLKSSTRTKTIRTTFW